MTKRFSLFKKALLLLLTSAFLGGSVTACSAKKQERIVIGYQYGVAYAPLLVMKEQNLLSRYLPDVIVEWQQFNGPTPIREGMLNESVTFGFMGISPVLIGIDNGMPWKYLTGLSSNRVAVISNRCDLKTLADIRPSERIAILSPGCTQHVLLRMLAKKQLGDAMSLDAQLVSFSHPDAMNALLSDTEIAIHVTTPPYLEEELNSGMYLMADGEEIMGEPFTFICGVAMTSYVTEHPAETKAFLEALHEAIDYINKDPVAACEMLAPVFGVDAEPLLEQMTYNGSIYSMELQGINTMSRAMEDTGFISQAPDADALFFGNLP